MNSSANAAAQVRRTRSAGGIGWRDSIYTEPASPHLFARFAGGFGAMRFRNCLLRAALAGVCLAAWTGVAGAQTGRVGGVIKDESDQPIKGATIRAENPNASPSSFTAVTDEKGRFSIIGLRTGSWTFTVEAAGFAPQGRMMTVQTI